MGKRAKEGEVLTLVYTWKIFGIVFWCWLWQTNMEENDASFSQNWCVNLISSVGKNEPEQMTREKRSQSLPVQLLTGKNVKIKIEIQKLFLSRKQNWLKKFFLGKVGQLIKLKLGRKHWFCWLISSFRLLNLSPLYIFPLSLIIQNVFHNTISQPVSNCEKMFCQTQFKAKFCKSFQQCFVIFFYFFH